MKKRILVVALLAMMLTVLSVPVAMAQQLYVYSDNGGNVALRTQPDRSSDVIVWMPYGMPVDLVAYLDNGWCAIHYDVGSLSTVGYAMSRYLTSYNPGTYVPVVHPDNVIYVTPTAAPSGSGSSSSSSSSSRSSSSSSSSSSSGSSADSALKEMNREYQSYTVAAEGGTVLVRATRRTGYVNLRWGPSTSTEVIRRCNDAEELELIAITNKWYQVRDPQTKKIGYISRNYSTVLTITDGEG